MRLRAVRLPEVVWRRGEQGVDAAGGFGGADLPGGEGGDFAEVGGEGEVLGLGWLVWDGCGGRGRVLGSRVRGSSSVSSSKSASSTISWRVALLGSAALVGEGLFMTVRRRRVVARI